ncbi:MAG TPA: hypothetical protein VGR35_09625 [Tepidisphaeraceae bacterium]|nr:hypothetical protein [Tepidisphaeraceae bacterium]
MTYRVFVIFSSDNRPVDTGGVPEDEVMRVVKELREDEDVKRVWIKAEDWPA